MIERKRSGLFVAIALLFCLFFTEKADAQVKEVINGKTYYVHTVEQGNTLYAISKMYAVDLNMLYENNPEAENGLVIGQKILIPFKDVKPKELKAAPVIKQEGLVHKVKKKETLYAISKKYNVDLNEIIARNPEAESGIVKGDLIVIPIDKVENAKVEEIEPAKPLAENQHLVKKQETLYGIANQYELKMEDIQEANGGLPDGLKEGMVLTIPNVEVKEEEVVNNEPTTVLMSGSAVEEVNIGLLLPFNFSLENSDALPETAKDKYKLTDIALEFYRGVRMALNERDDMDVNLFVYDMTKNEILINSFLRKQAVDELDIIIGPLHGSSFQKISKGLKGKDVHIVSPITATRKLIEGKSKCSKVKPSSISNVKFLAQEAAGKKDSLNVVVIDSDIFKDKELVDAFKAEFKSETGFDPTVVKLAKYNQQDLINAMSASQPNMIVVPSVDRPFVSDVFSRMADESMDNYVFSLYGLEQWMKFDNISTEQKSDFNVHIATSKFMNYDSEKVEKFLTDFYQEYKTIPVSEGYALVGYDITNFYLDGIYDYGLVFLDHLDQEQVEGLVTGFDFEKTKNGGWENKYNFLVKYEGFDIIRE